MVVYEVGNGSVFEVAAKANGVTVLKGLHSGAARNRFPFGILVLAFLLHGILGPDWLSF